MACLLDVNALIALIDSDHVQHEAVHGWFAVNASKGWATCPITENGVVRVLSQPAYPSGQRSPSDVIGVLRRLKASQGKTHQFWADEISLTDEARFQAKYIIGARQVTDVYLLGLAAQHGGKLVSFDRSLPWQAIRAATSALIEAPG
jgi:toxin-antitoxin system PIN domain toxin